MKALLFCVFAVLLSEGMAQTMMAAPSMNGPASSATNTNNNSIVDPNQRLESAPSNATIPRNTNNSTNSVNIDSNAMRNDSIGTTQSSTRRSPTPLTPTIDTSIVPAYTLPSSGGTCVDREGRSFTSNDSGYNACVNSLRVR